jgi:hypothetical protein
MSNIIPLEIAGQDCTQEEMTSIQAGKQNYGEMSEMIKFSNKQLTEGTKESQLPKGFSL